MWYRGMGQQGWISQPIQCGFQFKFHPSNLLIHRLLHNIIITIQVLPEHATLLRFLLKAIIASSICWLILVDLVARLSIIGLSLFPLDSSQIISHLHLQPFFKHSDLSCKYFSNLISNRGLKHVSTWFNFWKLVIS